MSTKELLAVYGLSWTMTFALLGPIHVLRRRGNPHAETSGLVVFGAFMVFCYVAAMMIRG